MKDTTRQIYELIHKIWAGSDPGRTQAAPVVASFHFHLRKNPLNPEKKAGIQARATPSMRSMFAMQSDYQTYTDGELLLHAFRDPWAKVLTYLKMALDYQDLKSRPLDDMASVFASIGFFLEKVQVQSFREILQIRPEEETPFALLLREIEEEILPEFYDLMPRALDETGTSRADVLACYRQLKETFPDSPLVGAEAIAPLGFAQK